MADHLTPEARSRNMGAIQGRNTRPELAVRRMLHAAGFRFRVHRKDLPGRPDIVFPSRRKAIFVHGCFWHRHPGCPYAYMPKTRVAFWQEKFQRNMGRDASRAKLREVAEHPNACKIDARGNLYLRYPAGTTSWPRLRRFFHNRSTVEHVATAPSYIYAA